MTDQDSPITRCPRLGCDIAFSYCLKERDPLPCGRILACWENRLPVATLLKGRLSEEEWNKAFQEPLRDRLSTILDLAGKAKKK